MMLEMYIKSAVIYESPECDVVHIKSEGVLCNSFETAEEDYYGVYEW